MNRSSPDRVHRRRANAAVPYSAPNTPARRSASANNRHASNFRSFWLRIPPILRMTIAALLVIAILTASVAITRNYLVQQEERRRLEAEAAELAQHPLLYGDMIAYYAGVQSIDPALISAIILSESSFDAQATSRLGARGLMQLMPDTAQWIAHKLDEDDENYSFDLLYDPETNIRFGSWYLGYLSRRFDGDPLKVVCAYHAGQGNVDAWLSKPQYSSDGVTLDVIPMENTETYANRVLKALNVYRKYYFPAPAAQTDPI